MSGNEGKFLGLKFMRRFEHRNNLKMLKAKIKCGEDVHILEKKSDVPDTGLARSKWSQNKNPQDVLSSRKNVYKGIV